MAAPSTLWLVEGEHHGVRPHYKGLCDARSRRSRGRRTCYHALQRQPQPRRHPQDWPAALSEHQTHMTDRYEPDELGYVEVNAVELIS